MALQHLRSSTANKRPTPAAMSDGQLAMNTNLASPGLFFKDSNGDSIKIGPVHVGTTAPNATPGAGGQAGNSVGEAWLDTTAANPILKVFNGSAFVAVQPVGTGTVVSTTDTGTVTSTMILDGTILNADINASAGIVDTKLATIATAGKVSNSATTATNANTASAIVARDASGNFTAGTITAALTGAASSNVLKAGDTMTGVLAVTAGTAALPSVAFTGDPNTGLFSPGADQVAISSNGVQRLSIGSTGNIDIDSNTVFVDAVNNRVGIGDSGPDARLTVKSSGASTTPLNVKNSSGTEIFRVFQAAGGGSQTSFKDSSGNTNIFIDGAAGQVGIGTTTPTAQLTSTSTIQITGFANPTGGTGLELGHDGTNGIIQSFNRATSAHKDLLLSASSIQLSISGTEKARIDSSGRLLVGTSTSSASTAAVFRGFAGNPTGQGIIHLQVGKNNAATAVNENLGSIRFANNEENIGAIISGEADLQWNSNDYPSRLVFSTTADGSASPTERMRIGSNGNTSFFGANPVSVGTPAGANSTTANAIFSGRHSATSTTSGGTDCVFITSNGNIINTNNSYGQLSDIKLKENIVNANSQWDDLKAVRVCNFNFKEGQTHRQIGVIAQEVELVSPGLVSESPDRDAEDNDLGTVTKSVNYSVLYMKAVKALQEAMERIEQLETSNTDLLARVIALETT